MTDQETNSATIDRAQWNRYKSGGGRCLVCGNRADISVALSATEITGARGGSQLAREKVELCNTHGLDRYGMALRVLQTGSVGKLTDR